MKLLSVLSLLSVFTGTEAKVTMGKSCLPFEVQTDFDLNRYKGRWYELYRDKEFPSEFLGTCGTATYTIRDDGYIDVVNRGWYWWWFFSYYDAVGLANCPDDDARCTVSFNPFNKDPTKLKEFRNYNVLTTDYENHSIIYTCNEIYGGTAKQEWVWLLSRENTMDGDTLALLMKKLHDVAPDFEFDKQMVYGRHLEEDNCFYK